MSFNLRIQLSAETLTALQNTAPNELAEDVKARILCAASEAVQTRPSSVEVTDITTSLFDLVIMPDVITDTPMEQLRDEAGRCPSAFRDEKGINIFVKLPYGRTKIQHTSKFYTTELLKSQIQDLEGVPPDSQRLIHRCRQLEDGRILADVST